MISAEQTKKIVQSFENDLKAYNEQLELGFDVVDSSAPEYINFSQHTRALYWPRHKQVVVFADRQPSEEDLQKSLYHEVFGHYGLSTFNEVDKAELFSTILQTKDDPSSSPGIKAVWQNIQKNYASEPPFVQAEEVFARVCEDKDLFKQTAWQKVREKFVSILKKIPGIKKLFNSSPSNEDRVYEAAKSVTAGIRNGQLQSKDITSPLDRQFGNLENEQTYNEVFSKLGQSLSSRNLQGLRLKRKEKSLSDLSIIVDHLGRNDSQVHQLLKHVRMKAEHLNISDGEMYHALFNPRSTHEEDFFNERCILNTLVNENPTTSQNMETAHKFYKLYQREEERCSRHENSPTVSYDNSPAP